MKNTPRAFRGRIAIGNADLICNTTYSEDSIYKGRNCNLKLKSSFTKVLWLAIQYRHKKRCTNCQDHKEMKRLLKQKLKEKLQRTTQTARNKVSRTVGSVKLYRDLYREIVLARTDYISRTLLVHEKANGSDAHNTLGLQKTVLLMANHDRNKKFKIHFVPGFCLYSNTTHPLRL